jgi:hypothetical protein
MLEGAVVVFEVMMGLAAAVAFYVGMRALDRRRS